MPVGGAASQGLARSGHVAKNDVDESAAETIGSSLGKNLWGKMARTGSPWEKANPPSLVVFFGQKNYNELCESAMKGRRKSMSKILLLEDDLSLINGLSFAFKKQGYELDIARTIQEADTLWAEGKYDLLVLDVSLPDGSGFDICRRVRQSSKVPIIFLTASDEEVNIIMGLDMGGDDYITKPFKLGVLMSRINALLRRTKAFSPANTELFSNGIRVLLLQGQAYKNDTLLDLTAAEYKLLCLFMQNPNVVLPKEQILDKLWDCEGNFVDSNTLTVYIRRLRMKIEDSPGEPQMLLTIRRMGYKWNVIR